MFRQSCSEAASAQRTLLYTGYLPVVAHHKEKNLQLLQLLGILVANFATNNFIQTELIPKRIYNHKYRLVRKYTLPQSSVPSFFLVLQVENLNYESRSGWAAPCREKCSGKYENGKDGNQVYILSQVQVAGKYGFETWDPCAEKLTVSGIIVFYNKIVTRQTRRVKVEFGRRTFPQYLVYSGLRNINPNYAMWRVTTH